MAPTVLCRTPDDAGVVDRTGILAASEPGACAVPTEELGVVGGPRRRVDRSGVAGMAAAVLMFVLALSFVVDAGTSTGPGGVFGDRLIVAERGSHGDRREQSERPARSDTAPTVAPDPRPAPKPAERPAVVAEQAPDPEQSVVAESAPEQVAPVAPAESAESTASPEPVTPRIQSSPVPKPRVPSVGVDESAPLDQVAPVRQAEPDLRADLPRRASARPTAAPTAPRIDRFRDLIGPVVELYQRSVRDVDAWRERLAGAGRGW